MKKHLKCFVLHTIKSSSRENKGLLRQQYMEAKAMGKRVNGAGVISIKLKNVLNS